MGGNKFIFFLTNDDESYTKQFSVIGGGGNVSVTDGGGDGSSKKRGRCENSSDRYNHVEELPEVPKFSKIL